ncbi:MAG: hypothetical protein E7294_13885 [Lachnospiraceae bacterium]|nr:hypothetical protein [Lachnospiraceae bacterium]
MFEKSFDLLINEGIILEKGLTLSELQQIERVYQIEFPQSLRNFLMDRVPVSKGFYNWRNFRVENVEYIKKIIKMPFDGIYNLADEVYWCDDWGNEPNDKEIYLHTVREKLMSAPTLLPIYSHRYIPMVSDINPPVFSIHGVDIIIYGADLEDYINIEFGRKKQTDIQFEMVPYIDFWSDIM